MYRNSSNGSGNRDRVEETNLTLMELENNQRWAELGEQVDLLKELSKDINAEVKSQNRMLDGMSDAFGSTTELFKSTIGKLGVMLTNPSSKHMYYLMGFIIFVFLVVYFMMNRKSSS